MESNYIYMIVNNTAIENNESFDAYYATTNLYDFLKELFAMPIGPVYGMFILTNGHRNEMSDADNRSVIDYYYFESSDYMERMADFEQIVASLSAEYVDEHTDIRNKIIDEIKEYILDNNFAELEKERDVNKYLEYKEASVKLMKDIAEMYGYTVTKQ